MRSLLIRFFLAFWLIIGTTIGLAALGGYWKDPEFDPGQRAFYYVRVLENPKCRWSTWDAIRNGSKPRSDLPVTIQERVWSSPIWYQTAATPNSSAAKTHAIVLRRRRKRLYNSGVVRQAKVVVTAEVDTVPAIGYDPGGLRPTQAASAAVKLFNAPLLELTGGRVQQGHRAERPGGTVS